jgi:mycothiol synthase
MGQMLTTEPVRPDASAPFLSYCLAHGPEHDESHLPGRDFHLSADFPAYLLREEQEIVGAAVLMRSPRYLRTGKGRLSVFHSVLGSREAYAGLLEALRPHFAGLRSIHLFIPEDRSHVTSILSDLGFRIERYSYVLENPGLAPCEGDFPGGYDALPLTAGDPAGTGQFARCLNDTFSELAGHADLTAKDIRAWFDDPCYLEGGICLLRHEGQPIGTVCVMRESETRRAAEVLAFGIVRPERGNGLGRKLLRYAWTIAHRHGLRPVMLSVNAENETALGLYRSEGFVLVETIVCYALELA